MSFLLSLPNSHELEFIPGLPADYKGPILKGGNPITVKEHFTELVIQELTGSNYTIRLMVGRLMKKIRAEGWIVGGGLYSYFMLKNGVRKEINSTGRIHVRQDQYLCFPSDAATCYLLPDKTAEFKAMDFHFSPNILEKYLSFYPKLDQYINMSAEHSYLIKAAWMVPALKEIIREIIECPFHGDERKFYYEGKVEELLLYLLEYNYRSEVNPYPFSVFESAKIIQAKEILTEYISKKPPSIRELSKRVAINEYKLKLGFRQYFKSGVEEWLVEEKMQRAKELVLTTDRPLKDICTTVGYPRITNFITAFRNRFGVTPGSLRR